MYVLHVCESVCLSILNSCCFWKASTHFFSWEEHLSFHWLIPSHSSSMWLGGIDSIPRFKSGHERGPAQSYQVILRYCQKKNEMRSLSSRVVDSIGCQMASLMVQRVKNLPAMQETQETQETQVQSLGQEDPLEKEMATHSSILAWEIPWAEGPGWLQSMGSQIVGHDRMNKHTRKDNSSLGLQKRPGHHKEET